MTDNIYKIYENNTIYVYPNLTSCEEISKLLGVVIYQSDDNNTCKTKCRIS